MWYWIRTILIVLTVTAMVWLFAEAESLRTEQESADVIFAADPKAQQVIDLVDAADPAVESPVLRVEMNVEGSVTAIEQFRRRLAAGVIRLTPGSPGVPATPGAHAVNLLEFFQGYPGLRSADSGVTVSKVSPATVNVFVDTLVTRTVNLEVTHPEGETEGPIDVRPRTLTMTLPKALADRVPESAVATVRIDDGTWRGLVPRQRSTLTALPVLPPPGAVGPHVKLSPSTADTTLTVLAKAASLRLPSVPVHIRIPPVEYGKWDLDIPEQDRFLNDVMVTGPADLIEQLRQRQTPVVAWVALSFEDLERGVTSKEVTFSDAPTPLRFESANKSVRVKVVRRDRPGG